MLSPEQLAFLEARRVAHLGTADAESVPHVVPVCFALVGDTAYVTVDEKPKRTTRLKRLQNIAENPNVTLVAATPPNVTPAPLTKFVPVIITVVPPVSGPFVGSMLVIAGAGAPPPTC